MGANFGILPPLPEKIRDKKERYAALADRAVNSLRNAMPDAM
jgi:methylenetetrahydrofolate--tRNA-(uracil-5-)-methyltransferase